MDDAQSYWIEVGKAFERFCGIIKLQDYCLIHSPKIIKIPFITLRQYFNMSNDEKTESFFDGFDNVDHFNNIIKMFHIVISNFHPKENKFHLIITDLHKRYGSTKISEIDANSYDKMMTINCVIRNITDKLDKTRGIYFECMSCGNQDTYVPINSDYYSINKLRAKYCRQCASKQMREFKKRKSAIIRFKLEDPSESAEVGGKTASIYAQIKDDIVSYFLKAKINVGDRVFVTGHLIDNPTVKSGQAISPYFFEIMTIERDTDREIFELTKEDEELIYSETKNQLKFRKKLIKSIAPKIEGYEDCKTALFVQELSGMNEDIKVWDDPTVKKGKVHIILAGDPSTAKTQLAKFMLKIAPKCYFASGDQSSIAGLLGTVYQDQTIGGDWTLSAGALVLANGGTIIIDELNKLDSKEISRLNQVLSDYVVPFDKAKVNTKIYTEVKLLGILNPSGDEWEKKGDLNRQKILQLNLKKAFTTRISLIFAFFEDDLNTNEQVELALRRQQGMEVVEDVYDEDFLKKIFILAKRKKVKFDNEELLKNKMDFFENIFKPSIKNEILNVESEDKWTKDEIPSKMRVFDSYEAILSGFARLNLTAEPTVSPTQSDYKLVNYFIKNYYMSMFFKTQKEFWSEAGINISMLKFTKQNIVMNLLEWMKVTEHKPDGEYTFNELFKKYGELGGENEIEFSNLINKLKMNGDIYEIRAGFFKKI